MPTAANTSRVPETLAWRSPLAPPRAVPTFSSSGAPQVSSLKLATKSPLASVSPEAVRAAAPAPWRLPSASIRMSALARAASMMPMWPLKPCSQPLNSAWRLTSASYSADHCQVTSRLGGKHSTDASALASTVASHSALTEGGSTSPSQRPSHWTEPLAPASHLAEALASQLAAPSTVHEPLQEPLQVPPASSSQVPWQLPAHSPAQLPCASVTVHPISHMPRQVPEQL